MKKRHKGLRGKEREGGKDVVRVEYESPLVKDHVGRRFRSGTIPTRLSCLFVRSGRLSLIETPYGTKKERRKTLTKTDSSRGPTVQLKSFGFLFFSFSLSVNRTERLLV